MAARSLLEEETNKTNRKKAKSVSEMPQQKKGTSSRRTAKSNGRSTNNVSKPKTATAVKSAGVASKVTENQNKKKTYSVPQIQTPTLNQNYSPKKNTVDFYDSQLYSQMFTDVPESEGLTGVKKDQMNYIVNKGKEAMQEREQAFNDWYTDDKQSLLFNDDGSLKDIQGELDLLNQNYKQNLTSLNSQQINDYFSKKRELEEALPQIQYLQDKYISENLTDKEDIKEFYTLQDAYNDTFGERALKTTGRVVGSILNMPFQAFDIAKQFLYEQQGYADFVDQNRDFYRNAGMSDEEIDEKAEGFRFNATDDNNWSQKLQKDLDDLGNQIYYGTNGAEQFALQTLEGVQNFGAHYLMAMATGGSSLATMGLQSGLDKTYQNLGEGYDINTSLGNGVLTGTLTVLTEKLPLDNFEKLVSSNLGQFSLAALASQAISEGTEEGIEYMAEPLIDKLTLGKEIDYDPGELFMSVALGMSSGAVLGGIGNMVPVINTRRQANQLQADMNTLEQYKNIGNLTTEEEIVLNRTLNIAQQALNNFNSKSVIGDAVKFQSDQVQQMSAREVSENFYKFLQPQVDTETRLASEQQAVRSVLQNAQSMLQQKGINMDVTQYASLDDNVKQQVDKIQSFANDLGINTVFDTNMDSAGMYYDGTVYINPESEIAPLTTFVHELTHGTESSRYYAPLQKLIFSMQNEEDIQYGLDLIKERYNENGIDLDDDGAIREYVAIQTQDLLGNEGFVKRLVRYNTSLASRIYEGIKNIVSKTDTMQDIEYNFLKAFRDNGINASMAPQYAFKMEDGSELELSHEQAVENAAKVLNMEPVAEIKENRFAKNPNKNLIQMANEYFDSLGNEVVRPGMGSIVLDEHGIKSLVGHIPRYQDRYAAIEAIPNVLQNGEVIRVNNNWKNRGKDTAVICAPISINQQIKYMSAVVEQYQNMTNRYYLHDLVMLDQEYKKNPANSLNKTRSLSGEELAEFTYNILNEAANVNNAQNNAREKDLLAIHNISSDKLSDSIDLGGLVMPSVAVTKDSIPHEGFGDISVVMDSSSIDPQSDSRNKVYSRDAWTPTFPTVEYKVDQNVQNRIKDLYYELSRKYGYEETRPLYRYVNELEEVLNREKGEANLIQNAKNDSRLQQLFLLQSGYGKVEPVMKETVSTLSDQEIRESEYMLQHLSDDVLNGYSNLKIDSPLKRRREYIKKYGEEIRNAYKNFLIEAGFDSETASSGAYFKSGNDLYNIVNNANYYARNGSTKVSTSVDQEATRNAVAQTSKNAGYDQWIENLFKGVEEKKGIRNNLDPYTRSGNRRSFEALHDEYNAENVLNAMLNETQTGGVGFGSGLNTMMAANAREFGSLDDIIASEDNLKINELSKDIHNELTRQYDDLRDESHDMYAYPDGNWWDFAEQFANATVESARIETPTPEDVIESFSQYDFNIDTEYAEKIIDLIDSTKNLSTDYFEAKPQRVITPNEWKQVYAPNTIDSDLRNQLEEMGIEVIEYDPEIEGDRQRKINENASRYKFSVGLTPEDLKATRKYERQKRIIINDLVNEAGLNNNLVDEDYGLLFNKAISDIQKTGDISEETLNELNDETWKRAVDVQQVEEPFDFKEFKQFVRDNPISMKSLGFTKERFKNPKRGVSGFASNNDWVEFKNMHFGKVKFRENGGRSIDSLYNEIKELYPGSVSNDIDTPYEQLMEISRVLDEDHETTKRVHLSNLGLLSRESFDAVFDTEMDKLREDVISTEFFHNFNTTPEAIKENVYFTDEEIQKMLDGKIINTDPALKKIEKVQETLTEDLESWLPNYEFIRNKYPEFSKGVFNKALFENMIYGETSEKTMNELKSDLMQYFADENVFEDMPVAKNRIDSLINDALNYFSIDAQYKTNKKYMDSIATKVNNLLKGYSGLYNGQVESTFQQVEAQQKADALLEAKRQARANAYKDTVDSLLAKGRDKISRFKTLEQNLDVVADGDAELRNDLRETLEYRRFNSQNNYVNILKEYNNLISEFVNAGIRKGSKASKALQWLREGHKEDGSKYDLSDLTREFNYKAKNGKMMYQNIYDAEKKLGQAYDDLFHMINSQRNDIYGNIDLHNDIETQQLKSKAMQAKNHLDNIKTQMANNPTIELQASLAKAEKDYRRLSRAYSMRVDENATHDSTRRQKLQYRENYAHHVANRGFFSSFKDRISGIREVPTKLAGISDYAEPKSGFANFFKKRNEGSYKADAIAGFEEYIQDAARVIAYDPYIDYLRDFADDMRVSAEGDNMSQFVRYITDFTNDIAGKTVDLDRTIRNFVGDKGFGIVKALNDRVKANAILGNVRTAFVQFSNIPNGIGIITEKGGTGAPIDLLKGSANYLGSLISGGKEDKSNLSPFLQSRFFDIDNGERGFRATLENVTDFMLTKGDEIGTKMIWNAAYQQAIRKGEEYPIFYADDLTRRAVAGRGVGEMPLAFKSKFMNLLIPFQLETNNAFKTMTGMAKKPKSWAALLTILMADWLFNNLYEELFGDRVLYDPIDVVSNAIDEYSSDEEQSETEFLKNLATRLGGETLGAMPFGSYIPTLLGMSEEEAEEFFGDSDPTRYGNGNMGLSSALSIGIDVSNGNYTDAASDFAANFLLPGGGKQIQRTIEALQVNGMLPQYVNGELVQEPVYYTGSGNIGFVNDPESIDDSPENMFDFVKQVLFGKWAGENAQNYINSGFDSLSGKNEKNLFDTLSETMSTFDAFNEAKNNSDAYENIQDSSDDSEDSGVDSSIISEFDAKQDELTGKNNAKSQFIDSITESDYTASQKNAIYDTYYGESKLTEFVNDFADQQDVDDETRYALKTITGNTSGITDENGDSVRNSKALKVRKQLDELGLYDDYLNYISENDLDLSYMGLSKTVAKMSNAEFESEYNQMYGENYTAKSDEELLNEAYDSIFGGSGTGGSSNKKSSAEDDYESYTTMKNEIDTILAKAYGGASSVDDAYDKINNIISKIYSTNSKNSSSIKSAYSDLIEEYLEDHPTDAYLFS